MPWVNDCHMWLKNRYGHQLFGEYFTINKTFKRLDFGKNYGANISEFLFAFYISNYFLWGYQTPLSPWPKKIQNHGPLFIFKSKVQSFWTNHILPFNFIPIWVRNHHIFVIAKCLSFLCTPQKIQIKQQDAILKSLSNYVEKSKYSENRK